MAEFENNNNAQNAENDNNTTNNNNVNSNDANSNHANNQNQSSSIPEYSFWAEQVSNTSNYNNNQSNGSQGNGNQSSGYQNGANQNNPNQSYGYQNNGYQNNSGYSNYGNQNTYQGNPNTSYSYQNNPNPNSAFQNYTRPEKKHSVRKPMNKAVKFVSMAICFGLVAGLSFFGFQEIYYSINPNAVSNVMTSSQDRQNTAYEIGYTESASVVTEDKSVIEGVAEGTLPAIVSINCLATETTQWFGQSYDQQVEGSGSGIIVGKDEKELLIATNNHVVEGADNITVTFADGSEAEAIVKGTDSTADLAVVTVDISTLTAETLKSITVAKLGNSDDVEVGEMVIAIGNALGYGQSVTVGYVSAKDREVEVSDTYSTKTMVLLQTDAAINPGNSGGALINIDGEVIGINTVKYASSEVEGMGYAIPISEATPIINDLMTREVLTEAEKGYLGIMGQDVTEDVASYYNMPVGVYVEQVSEGGAADKAGLLAEDIITGADDLEISSISQLKEYVNSLRVGTEVTITYMRNTNGKYEEATVTVTLEQYPNAGTEE